MSKSRTQLARDPGVVDIERSIYQQAVLQLASGVAMQVQPDYHEKLQPVSDKW